MPGFEQAAEKAKPPALHVAVRKYLAEVEAMKKRNTYRKYNAVLNRFLELFRDRQTVKQISRDDLTAFVIALKKQHRLSANTILHNNRDRGPVLQAGKGEVVSPRESLPVEYWPDANPMTTFHHHNRFKARLAFHEKSASLYRS